MDGGILIRPLTRLDEARLWEMLYLAIYLPPGATPVPRSRLRQPPLANYVEGWGRQGDFGFAAMDGPSMVGAAWARQFSASSSGFGFVDASIPELSLAVEPAHRARGVGSRLLDTLLKVASERAYAISLSVTESNPAFRMYAQRGFEVTGRSGDSLTMLRRWGDPPA